FGSALSSLLGRRGSGSAECQRCRRSVYQSEKSGSIRRTDSTRKRRGLESKLGRQAVTVLDLFIRQRTVGKKDGLVGDGFFVASQLPPKIGVGNFADS